jgi:hypothetical protein
MLLLSVLAGCSSNQGETMYTGPQTNQPVLRIYTYGDATLSDSAAWATMQVSHCPNSSVGGIVMVAAQNSPLAT